METSSQKNKRLELKNSNVHRETDELELLFESPKNDKNKLKEIIGPESKMVIYFLTTEKF